MRNVKKLIALMLAVTMALSVLILPSFAEETESTAPDLSINAPAPKTIFVAVDESLPERSFRTVVSDGITITGGMAQLAGMAQLITEATGIESVVADDPASCVALGCGKSLAWINHMQEGPVNLARRRFLNKNE